MSGLFVFIGSPAGNSTIGRSATVSGSVSGAGSGSLNGASIQFGVNGPVFNLFGRRKGHVVDWSWQGLIPVNIRPGQAFQIIVRSDGVIQTKGGPEPEFEPVDGVGTLNVVLENVLPVLTVAPLQSPVVVMQLPHAFEVHGSVSEPNPTVYGVPQIQYQLDGGPLANLPALAAQGPWSVTLPPLPPGDHLLTLRAVDRFESVTTFQRTLSVIQFDMPAAQDPQARRTLSGVPSTSSITSWTRIEPQNHDADIDTSSSARVFDPLWMLTRQWQVGEFQAEDAGTPVQARVRATSAMLTRCRFGELAAETQTKAAAYDPLRMPLETLVERRRMRAADANEARLLPLAVEAGLHFLRLLERDATAKKYRAAFLARYALPALAAEAAAAADAATVRSVALLAGRAPDARRLASALRPAGGAPIVFDAALKIAAADVNALRAVALAWLAWYDALFTEPAGAEAGEAWNPQRLEYALSVSARLSADQFDEVTYAAREFDGGALDWSSFDLDQNVAMGTAGDRAYAALSETTVPAPVSFRGMPAARFWEMEDANVAYGLLPVGPTDLAQMMMIEYASSYGNDWYVVPLTLPVGSVTRIDSLVVTDTFGVRSLLRPIGDPALPRPHFAMWQADSMRRAGQARSGVATNRFFLPPTVGRPTSGAAVEDVLFLRDEMANMAWAIERCTESPIEQAAPRDDAADAAPAPAEPRAAGALPRYRLSSDVAPNWIPLLPVQMAEGDGTLVQRLKRGAVLQSNGTPRVNSAQGEVLNAGAELLLFDEEVPREGVRVTRQRTLARWTDGSTWLWTGLHKRIGRGEGSSGLRFDEVEEPGPAPAAR